MIPGEADEDAGGGQEWKEEAGLLMGESEPEQESNHDLEKKDKGQGAMGFGSKQEDEREDGG